MKAYDIYARPLFVADALPLVTTLDDAQYQAFRKSVRTSWRYWLREAAHFFYQLFVAFERSLKTFAVGMIFILAFAVVFLPEVVVQFLEPGLMDLPALLSGLSLLFVMGFVCSFVCEIWIRPWVFTSEIKVRYDDAVNELIGREVGVATWRIVVQENVKSVDGLQP